MELSELETPVPVVDVDRLDRNIERMARYAAAHGLALRPHTKTHKSACVAAAQMHAGAVGLTCATLREAEIAAEVTRDVLIAFPVLGATKVLRLAALAERARLTVAVDSIEALDSLAAAARAAGCPIGVYLERDMGMHRTGAQTDAELVRLIRAVLARDRLEYRGVMYYAGHIRGHVEAQGLELAQLRADLCAMRDHLDREGLSPPVVSGGSTPTAWVSHEMPGLTEIRPGTYVFNDRTTVEIGACTDDACAVTVLATVISTAVPDQIVVDAGVKALGREPLRGSTKRGFGTVADHREAVVERVSEEHGMIDVSATMWRPAVGETIRIVPNHVCIAVSLADRMVAVREGRVIDIWPVDARARSA